MKSYFYFVSYTIACIFLSISLTKADEIQFANRIEVTLRNGEIVFEHCSLSSCRPIGSKNGYKAETLKSKLEKHSNLSSPARQILYDASEIANHREGYVFATLMEIVDRDGGRYKSVLCERSVDIQKHFVKIHNSTKLTDYIFHIDNVSKTCNSFVETSPDLPKLISEITLIFK